MITRRDLLRGILAAGIAPAYIKAEILMPPRNIILPTPFSLKEARFQRFKFVADGASRSDPFGQYGTMQIERSYDGINWWRHDDQTTKRLLSRTTEGGIWLA